MWSIRVWKKDVPKQNLLKSHHKWPFKITNRQFITLKAIINSSWENCYQPHPDILHQCISLNTMKAIGAWLLLRMCRNFLRKGSSTMMGWKEMTVFGSLSEVFEIVDCRLIGFWLIKVWYIGYLGILFMDY